jgi:hypothetical protein
MNKFLIALFFVFSSLALAVVPPLSDERLSEISQAVVLGFVHRVELLGVKVEQGSETRSYKAEVYVYNRQKGNLIVGKSIPVFFAVTRAAPSAVPGGTCASMPQATLRLGDQAKVFLNATPVGWGLSHSDGVRLVKNTASRADLPDEAHTLQEMPIPAGLK